ncbi:leucine rich repeat [Seminavis robusta]|uniref:Leucine rich repeat n=1 Tax=Seminavis robusta TaxID=568900 RepID=A0A9N8ERT6_9STRA|nr:leucine rich repeat [Seminavis robusta]|eukprot:Sro1475_g275840.1 leucine rich repeat (652) ;mRNA; r:12941-15293
MSEKEQSTPPQGIFAAGTWQEATQTPPAMGIPVIPETPQEESPPFLAPEDREVAFPGAFRVNGPANQDNNVQQEIPQAPIDALVTHSIEDCDEEVTNMLNLRSPAQPNQRSRKYWRQRLLHLLSLEINVVLLAVIMALLIFVAVSEGGNTSNSSNSNNSQSINQQNGALQVPATAGVAKLPTRAPASFLDSLNLSESTLSAMEREQSPQSKAYKWLTSNLNNQSSTQQDLPNWRLVQRFGLATFYYSTGGDYWVRHRGWLDWDTNECRWEQLFIDSSDASCNNKGEIKALEFSRANNMDGTIPPEVSLLSRSLQSFHVNRQLELKGTIPTEVGLLSRLTMLILSGTALSGTLPTEIGQLQDLQTVRVYWTGLHGCIPSELGTLGNLSRIGVAEADLTGSVPDEVFQLPSLRSLELLECSGLNTEFTLQEATIQSKYLKQLFLSGRTVGAEMAIPSEIGTLTELKHLTLNDWRNSGTILSEFGRLTKLASLDLRENSIVGTLPHELFELTYLSNLQLGSNQLEGLPPPGIFSALTRLNILQLNDNHFSGKIPTEVGLLSSLVRLELQNTDLFGTLPTELLQLENLTRLVVTNTSLSGSIPEELCDKMYRKDFKCFGNHDPPCRWIPVKTNTTVCHGTSLCGCDCRPCPKPVD